MRGFLTLVSCLALGVGCVHSTMERTGRLRLDGGGEGRAPVLASLPSGFEEVGVITVRADGIATGERLDRHLLRRAALMGCDGVVGVQVEEDVDAEAVCVKRREPVQAAAPRQIRVREPSPELVAQARLAGAEGTALVAVLTQLRSRPAAEREWPLRWYLQTYPDSRFAPDVGALFEEVTPTYASPDAVSVRGAPTTP
ncbi:MAG: hypothetical protein HY903_13895 [Deltaproteobacteria bacterium]|nr:hypothetical protein [Deltaproteobacteria bacterium]